MFGILKEILGIDRDRFIPHDESFLFGRTPKLTLLSVAGKNDVWGWPGFELIGIGKSVDLVSDLHYEECCGQKFRRGHLFRFEYKYGAYGDKNTCYLEVGESVRDGVHRPAIQFSYYRKEHPYWEPDPHIVIEYIYSEIAPGIIRAVDRNVQIELRIGKAGSV